MNAKEILDGTDTGICGHPPTRGAAFWTLASAGVLAASLVWGCSSTKYGKVAIEWSRMIREQQVVPVFPPREDIRVGDVFLSAENPEIDPELKKRKTFLPIPLLFARIPLEGSLAAHYTDRPAYPKTPTNELQQVLVTNTLTTVVKNTNGVETTTTRTTVDPGLLALPSTSEATDDSLFTPAPPRRIPQVGFPEFSFAKISQADLQAVIPIDALNLALGGSWSDARAGTVKISSGESISLPAPTVHAAVMAVLGTNYLRAEYQDFALPMFASAKTNSLWLTVVTEGFYARTLDVAFESAKSLGLAAGVNGAPATGDFNPQADPAARAKALNERNAELLSRSTPGGSLTYTSVSKFNIGLRRTYARPIAVGIRSYSVLLQLEPGRTGDRVKMVATSSSTTGLPLGLPAALQANPALPARR